MSGSQKGGGKSTGPKMLRIGIVQNGKIIDERELRKRETVSIGSHAKATFQVTSDRLPKTFDLFDYDGKAYYLRFNEQMEGRIQLDGNTVSDFSSLESAGKVARRGGEKAVRIADVSRGKVMIGDITILFQFKAVAPIPDRPVLPAEIRGSMLQNIDAQFTAIFVLVALIHISVVTYARNQPYVEPTSIDQIDETYQKLIMPERIPEPPKDPVADNSKSKGDEDKKKPEKKKPEKKKPEKKKPSKAKSPEDAAKAAKARKAAIKKKVAGKGLLKVLGAKGNGSEGGALADVFSEGDGAAGSLGDAFSGIQGVDIASAGDEAGTRGGGAGENVGIGELGTEGGGSVKTAKKREASVKGSAQAQAPEVDGELSQAQIARVMKRKLKSLRACYEGALKRNRQLKGKLVIEFEIMETGRTSNVEFSGSLNSKEVQKCIKRRAKSWRFPKPDGGSVFVSYPIIFSPAG